MINDLSLPDWVLGKVLDYLEAFEQTEALCQERCDQLLSVGRWTKGRVPADPLGTYDDYRKDAMYCHGQAHTLRIYLLARASEAQVSRRTRFGEDPREAPGNEASTDPRRMAQWVTTPWSKLAGSGLPEPDEALRMLRPHELMEKFTSRESEALILCYALGMKTREAAAIMGCKTARVQEYLLTARHKFTPNEGYSGA